MTSADEVSGSFAEKLFSGFFISFVGGSNPTRHSFSHFVKRLHSLSLSPSF
jgi:hypothetical protein